MQHLENFCDVTLVSEDDESIRAHKVVLASVSAPLEFQTDDKNYYELINMSGAFSKFMIS